MDVPFAERGDLSLKKIGLEVIVRVGAQKRTIMLPPALAAYATAGARFEDGSLEITFEKEQRWTGSRRRPTALRGRAARRRPTRPPCSCCSTECAGWRPASSRIR